MAISKRLRYEVLRRDNYACRYCGVKVPDVELRVDHVIPKALGGSDDPSNLAAACEPCNTGKTSSSPDAPLVAEVTEDALRWSRALTVVADRMRSQLTAQTERYRQFDEWWSAWTYGADRLPIPRDPGWQGSVDGFLAAGLPLEVLEWCVQRAMTSRAAPDKTWRYMCGVAWNKVTELQEAATPLATEDASEVA